MQIVLPHSKPTLSVLICHLPERAEKLQRLLGQLYLQVNDHAVEIIVNEGDGTTGYKRNELIKAAKGKYIVSFDDDDEPSYNYFDKIFKYLDGKNAAVGFVIEFRFGKHIIPMICTSAVTTPISFPDCIFKPITHIQPILKELCVEFPDITKDEDVVWWKKMAEVLKGKRCAFILETLYFYNQH